MDSDKLKQIQLDMLIHFIRICERNNLQYFLVGGTALGAVRHQGFIPWDDDIDVGMPRSDYEKFLKIASTELPAHLFLQTGATDKDYPMNFAKIRNSNTTFIEKSLKNLNINHGVYIDVFPLDGYKKNKIYRLIFDFKNKLYQNRISDVYYFDEGLKRSWRGKIMNYLAHYMLPDYKNARDRRDRLIKDYSYENAEIVTNYCGAWGEKETVPKSYFGNGVAGCFEGITVILPEEYDRYLTHVYGDYMTPPPKQKQVGHHLCTVIDLEKSYLEYII